MEFGIEILWYILPILGAIMILVFVHEMGHFLFAKLFGMRVDRFSIGFPPTILGKQVGETEYVLGATPLGGYVKIAGMVDESMDTEFVSQEPEPWEFRAKPIWQRIVVITAGVVFNMILAFVIFAAMGLSYGDDYIPAENIEEVYVAEGSVAYNMGVRTGDRIVAVSGKPLERYDDIDGLEGLLADPFTITVERDGRELTFEGPDDIMTQLNRTGLGISAAPSLVGSIVEGSAAEEIGLQPGDRIVAIEGEPVRFWGEMTERIQASEGAPLTVRFAREGEAAQDEAAQDEATQAALVERRDGVRVYETRVAPRFEETYDQYLLGVGRPTNEMLAEEFGQRHVTYGFGAALGVGLEKTWVTTKAIATSLKRVFTGRENFRENVGGPIAIAQVTKQAAQAGARVFWNIVAFLSITLAIMNILPIPALDGGHLMFLIYEGITRREPSLRVRMAMQQVGMILLLAFMTFLIFNDILRL